jgi:tetraacyldisaccharide 4'-kinase
MNFTRKILLIPLSAVYLVLTFIRNYLYESKIYKSTSFCLPIIGVGNLTVGGTGKTPLTEYILRILLKNENKAAVLSRGYKRASRGYVVVSPGLTAKEIGDEVFQIKRKYGDACIAVCENRITGVTNMMKDFPDIEAIVLDDAYQHRAIKPGLNILVSEYHKPWYKDMILPSGNLRESRKGYRRADIIVISKSPRDLTRPEALEYIHKIKPYNHQQVFFSRIQYNQLVAFTNFPAVDLTEAKKEEYFVLVFTGIVNTEPYLHYLKEKFREVNQIRFPDHHKYTNSDFEMIKTKFNALQTSLKILITTEKDISRIENSEPESLFKTLPLYYIPIEFTFNFDDKSLNEENDFDHKIKDYVEKN